jgi:phosphoribosylaminoimidazole-succinocarboxamide synthase
VRDIYELSERTGQPQLLIVATDRISAFDVVLPTGIPDKGRVLTGLSLFWFNYLAELTAAHFLTADLSALGLSGAEAKQLAGRSMLVRQAEVLPVECVVRGYLAGSGWREYRASGKVCGLTLPEGLRESDELGEPVFTPSTKAEAGHDRPLTFEQVGEIVGEERAEEIRRCSIALYTRAAAYARQRGIIIADTKFEWGLADGDLILVDEVLTPDSSRFWPAEQYEPGLPQPSFDKQFVRDYLDTLDWDKTPPGPELPPDVVAKTSEKYVAAYELLTGKRFPR